MASTAFASGPLTAKPLAMARRIDWPVVIALLLLVILVRGASFGNPVAEMDDQLYSFVGWRMLHGELPFVDWFDRKPFGLFSIFAFAHLLAGSGPMAYQGLAMLSTLGGALMVYRLARPLADRAGAGIAGGFYIVLMTAFAGASGQSEAFFVPLMLLAAALVRDPAHPDSERRAMAAMALCGVVLQIKYTVLPQCAFLGAWVLWGQFRRGAGPALLARRAAMYVALGIAPTALVGLLYLAIGGWDEFWFANFVSFFQRAGVYGGRFHSNQIMWAVVLGMPLVGALYYGLRVAPPRDLRRYGFYLLWSCPVLVTVFMPKTIYMFYLAALAPCVALLATPFYARATIAGIGPALLLLASILHVLDLPDRYASQRTDREDFARFAAEVSRHVDGDNRCLYVFDGPMALYRMSGGCTMSRVIYPDHLNNALETGAVGVDQVDELARIMADRPAVIVTASRSVTPQNPGSIALATRITNRDYQPFAHTRIATRIITAWARKDFSVPSRDTIATIQPRQ